jgi:multiple sugar transport system substrate-binding protein
MEKTKVLFDAEPWVILKGAKLVQEAKDFLKVYYRKDLYRELTLTVPLHLSPILKSIADEPSYEREPAIREWRSWYEVMRTALRENRAAPLLMTSVQERNPIMLELQGSKVISDMVLEVVVGGKSPEEAAANGQKKAEELVAKLGWKKW